MYWLRRIFAERDLDCTSVRKLTSDYLEAELSPSRLQRFRSHIAKCGPCKSFVDSLMTMVKALGALPQSKLPPNLRALIQGRIAEERKRA